MCVRISFAAFINKPSDAMMFFILGGCTLFFLWVLFRSSNISTRSSDTDEDAAGHFLEPGCLFVGKGYVITILLIAIGVALVSAFQALHPGQ